MINIKNEIVIKALGTRVRELRISRGLSQEKLANMAEIPLSQMGRIERGETNPTISTIHVLSVALEVDIVELFTKG